MNRGRYFPVLDGLRGLAIIGVLLTHAAVYFQAHGAATRWFLPVMQFGQWGVDLFFVLSGFLITGILLDTRTAINRAGSFFGRHSLESRLVIRISSPSGFDHQADLKRRPLMSALAGILLKKSKIEQRRKSRES